MRLRYDEKTLTKIRELVLLGKTNAEICKEFGVDYNHTSLCTRIRQIRSELGITPSNLTSVGVVKKEEKPVSNKVSEVKEEEVSKEVTESVIGITAGLKNCTDAINVLGDTVVSRLENGFSRAELHMLQSYSNQITELVTELESVQSMFNLMLDIRKDK